MLRTFLVVAALTQQSEAAGDHGGVKEKCSCAQAEPDHPFTIDCSNRDPILAATTTLETTCTENNAGYEWGGAFATPANAYKWVAQAASEDNTEYADPSMKLVVFDVHAADKEHLLELAETAKTLIAGTCTVVNTQGDIPKPTEAGACYTLTFPTTNPSTNDFHATVDTTGVANVAFFGEHGPTEFERDTHYFMSTDLATDIEPVNELGASAGHDHGRRLSAVGRNDRRSRRRLANPGSCCLTAKQQGAWKQVVSYHDQCEHDQVPEYIEVGFHDYEASCENYFCNLVGPDVDQTVCPYSPPTPPPPPSLPPSPVATESTGIEEGTLIGVIVAAVVVAAILLAGVCCLVAKEKAGKPLFTNLDVKPDP